MRSLQDGEETATGGAGALASAMEAQRHIDDNATLPPTRTSSARSQFSDLGSSYTEDADTEGALQFRASPSSTHSSMSGSDAGSQSGRTRVDGKEFFREVRSRLSYEQFGAFLANVKDLNSHKQTKEESLRKACEIFGPENKDLYSAFEGLITRNVH